MKKIEVSFLKSLQEPVQKSLQMLKSIGVDNHQVQTIRAKLNHLEKVQREILKESILDDSGTLLVEDYYVPEILWMRNSAARIVKIVQENPRINFGEIGAEIQSYYEGFAEFYRLHA